MNFEQLGPYRIVGKLGRGGMGAVYEGVSQDTQERAAIKVLEGPLADDEGFRERFAAEIEALKMLNHPGIVRLLGFGQLDDRVFYAMELVEGVNLEQELARGRHFDWREVAAYGVEVCRALRHAHDRGIVHRDIKPANLLLGQDGHVRLSDFGIARLFGNNRLTAVGSVLGTAEYMAPEQAEGKPVDARADLYSLGGVFYALLARRPPFRATSLPEMLHKQRYAVPDPIRVYAPDVPEELDSIIAKLLAKEPDARFATAQALGRRLEMMLNGYTGAEPTLAGDDNAESPNPGAGPASVGLSGEVGPTREMTPSDWLRPPGQSALAPPSATPVAETMATHSPEAGGPPAIAPPLAAATSAGRFVEVSPDDLDRAHDDSGEHRSMVPLATIVLAVAMLFVGAAAWYFLQPPSADSLYERIVARRDLDDIESLLAAESDIDRFLAMYAGDPRSRTLREYAQEIELYRLERRFERTAAGLFRSETRTPVERDYLDALQLARSDPEAGLRRMQAILDLYQTGSRMPGPNGNCLELVRRRAERLRKQVDDQASAHLAAINERLDQADARFASNPQAARAAWNAVIELYGEKEWARDAVARARAALMSHLEKSASTGSPAAAKVEKRE